MKNSKSNISQAASKFRSKRRIALTGSPLANNLDEYFVMIDWIAPGYLGDKDAFRSKYAIPIAEGLWNDSSSWDRRCSLRKLHMLKRNLEPKVSRADISCIAHDLPSKTEFFITVPLTSKQVKAYNMFVGALLGACNSTTAVTARLFDWLSVLSLLCNHPAAFLTKLDERKFVQQHKKRRNIEQSTSISDLTAKSAAGLPSDVDPGNIGLPPTLIDQQKKLFEPEEESGRLEDVHMSHRTYITFEIIQAAATVGDRVLLFSHSIPTLNYLQTVLEFMDVPTCRMDGNTKVTTRQESVKEFNNDSARYRVFLISTRAGGLGLNLHGANRVILFDYGFNPQWEEQAIGRAYRLGQTKPVFVYRLRSGGTFEELIYNKAVFKSQLSARVVDRRNPMRHASRNVHDYLFNAREVAQADLQSFKGKDPLVLDRILDGRCDIRDIILTETFQKEDDEFLTPEEVRQANLDLEREQTERKGRRAPDPGLRQLSGQSAPATSTSHKNIASIFSAYQNPLPQPQSLQDPFRSTAASPLPQPEASAAPLGVTANERIAEGVMLDTHPAINSSPHISRLAPPNHFHSINPHSWVSDSQPPLSKTQTDGPSDQSYEGCAPQ